MPKACFKKVVITGVATCTGPITRTLDDEASIFVDAADQMERIRKFVGINQRHLAPAEVTALDMAEAATKRLFAGRENEMGAVDAIVFVTQTADHPQPSNANLLHGRLGLGKDVAAFDINQGCSGWVYGAYVAAGMVEAGGCNRVLLLTGDTISHTLHSKDRALVPLFSDACSATLLERRDEASPWWFDLHSDGRGADAIKIPAGGARRSRSAATAVEAPDSEGNIRSPDNLAMNGLEVFNFTLREEPAAVRAMLEQSGHGADQIDFFVFHQANHFISTNLAKRLKIPMEKVPTRTLADFGNQSSASIPSTLCHDLGEVLCARTLRILCSGFGVGLSWASCMLQIGPLFRCETFRFNHQGGHHG